MPNTILIIDDNAEYVSSLQIGLEAEGYVVISALDPINGWKKMEQCQPDIILVDWDMQGLSGIDLVKLMKADVAHRSRYIIMITAYTGTKNIVQGLDAGADDYLGKIFEINCCDWSAKRSIIPLSASISNSLPVAPLKPALGLRDMFLAFLSDQLLERKRSSSGNKLNAKCGNTTTCPPSSAAITWSLSDELIIGSQQLKSNSLSEFIQYLESKSDRWLN